MWGWVRRGAPPRPPGKSPRPPGGPRGRPDTLQGHRAPVLRILGQVHGRHAAPAELSLDQIAAGEARADRFEVVDHEATGPPPPPGSAFVARPSACRGR